MNHTLTPFARQLRTIALEEVPSPEAKPMLPVAQNHRPRKSPRPLSPAEQLRQERRQYWEARFSEVHELLQQGWSISAVARYLNLDRKTVRKYEGFDVLPPKTCTRLGPRIIDPYRAYLQERLLSENPTGRQLLTEIQAQGYRGSKSMVTTFVAQFRRTHGLPLQVQRAEIGGVALPVKGLTVPTLATWVIMTEEQRTSAQSRCIRQACALHPRMARAIELTEQFAQALRSRQSDFLDTWIPQVSTSGLPPLAWFAQGLTSDYAAVQASFTSPYSNGQLEGQITRLKLLKRQMYGRAKFDLLSLRVLRP